MPANSFGGQRATATIVSGEALFVFHRSLTYADVRHVPSGGTALQLPDGPSGGDYYEWVNPDNTVGAGSPIALTLSAASVDAGITVQGAPSQFFTDPGSSGYAVFFEGGGGPGVWQLFRSAAPGGTGPVVAAAGGELVWRPGATASPGVAVTWAEVAAAIAGSPVPLTVYVDATLATAIVPGGSGVTDLLGTTRLLSFNFVTNGAGDPEDGILLEDGATLHRPREIADNLNVVCQCVTTPALSFQTNPSGMLDTFYVSRFARITLASGATVGVVQVPTGGVLQLVTAGFVSFDNLAGPPAMVQLEGTASLVWIAFEGLNLDSAFTVSGAVGSAFQFEHDSTIVPVVNTDFLGTYEDVRLDLAAWALPSAGSTAARPLPPNVVTGQIYFDATLATLVVWNGGAWQSAATGGGSVVSVAGSAPIVSSGGLAPVISITGATDVAAGSMSAADKTKLDGITAGAAVSAVTGTAPIASSGGTDPAISISAATGVAAGSMSAADKAKLDAALPTAWTAVAAGATGAAAAGVASAFACDTTGARCAITLPAAPTDGQVVQLKAVGASNTNGISITPGAGGSVENPGAPGVVLAANAVAVTFDQGVGLTYRYQAAGTRWLIQARA